MARSTNVKATVTTLSGDRIEIDVEPGFTAQDIIGALVQDGKLPGEDSLGNPMRYELISDATLSVLPGDRPLLELGLKDATELRVKPGARVA